MIHKLKPHFAGFVTLLALAAPARPADQTPLSCALLPDVALELPDSAALKLLEVNLSKREDVALLERAEIERLLESRTYETAFAANGGVDRRNLGALLRVDLLVVMRGRRGGEEAKGVNSLDVVIAETSTGLRLSEQTYAWDERAPEPLVETIATDVAHALTQVREPVAMILTVPPLISDDLTGQFDAMQAACATFIRQAAASAPGVRVVALEEGLSIAEEFKLSAGDGVTRELQPYFITGHYRNNITSGTRLVDITVEVTQAGVALTSASAEGLPPEKTPDFLRATTGEFLQTLAGRKPTPSDPMVEKAQLLKRAADFQRLNDWREALDLYETALLIDSSDAALHGLALEACAQVANRSFHPSMSFAEYKEHARRGIGSCLRGLDHLEFCLRAGKPDVLASRARGGVAIGSLMDQIWIAGSAILKDAMAPRSVRELAPRVADRKRAILLSYFELKAKGGPLQGTEHDRFLKLFNHEMARHGSSADSLERDKRRLGVITATSRNPEGNELTPEEIQQAAIMRELVARRAELPKAPVYGKSGQDTFRVFSEIMSSFADDIRASGLPEKKYASYVRICDQERASADQYTGFKCSKSYGHNYDYEELRYVPYLGQRPAVKDIVSLYEEKEKASLDKATDRVRAAERLDQSVEANRQQLKMAWSMRDSIRKQQDMRALTRYYAKKAAAGRKFPTTAGHEINIDLPEYPKRFAFLNDLIGQIERGEIDVTHVPNLLSSVTKRRDHLERQIEVEVKRADFWEMSTKEWEEYVKFLDALERSMKVGDYDAKKHPQLAREIASKRAELAALKAKVAAGDQDTKARLARILTDRRALYGASRNMQQMPANQLQAMASGSLPGRGGRPSRGSPPTPRRTPRPLPDNAPIPSPMATPKPIPPPKPTPGPTPAPVVSTTRQTDLLKQEWSIKYTLALSLPTHIRRWISCGEGVDLICGARDLFVMKEKGKARNILRLPEEEGFRDLVYDGQYAWASVNNKLYRVNLDNEKVETITEADGLPPGRILLSALEPGRLVVVGFFGRTWIANVTWPEGGKPSVDVFHEARFNEGGGEEIQLAFMPRFVWTARRSGGDRVVVARGLKGEAGLRPLIVDPAARSVTVSDEWLSVYVNHLNVQERDGALCWLQRNSYPKSFAQYVRLDAESLRVDSQYMFEPCGYLRNLGITESVGMVESVGALVFIDDRPVFINWNSRPDRSSFLIDTDRERLVKLEGQYVPDHVGDIPRFYYSSHYGPIVVRESASSSRSYRISLTPPADEIFDAMTAGKPAQNELSPITDNLPDTLLVRVYSDPVGRPHRCQEFNVPFEEDSFCPIKAGLPSPSIVMLVGSDQPNVRVKRLYRDKFLTWELGKNASPEHILRFDDVFLPASQQVARNQRFIDAAGDGMAGAIVEEFMPVSFGNTPTRLQLSRRSIDSLGRKALIAPLFLGRSVRVTDRGRGIIEVPELGAALETMLPMTGRGTGLWRTGARGVVVGADEKPIPEARIVVNGVKDPAGNVVPLGSMTFIAISDRRGEFQYLVPPSIGKAPSGSTYSVTITGPADLGLHPFKGDITSGQSTRVKLTEAAGSVWITKPRPSDEANTR